MCVTWRALPGAVLSVSLLLSAGLAQAAEVNLYSSRHYQTDERLYEEFTKQTGIQVNRIEGKGGALLERIKSEGRNSPADVFLTVDAGFLYRAQQEDVFQPVDSAVLKAAVPENLRHPDNLWFGLSTRARLIFYDKKRVKEGEITSYEDLADPKWAGKVCIRKSTNVYNQSLLASIVAEKGEASAEAWAKGVVANFARDPVKGDTNQLRGIGTGECAIAVANSYYFARLMASEEDEDKALVEQTGVVFPNQGDRGTHINISGAGVLKNAPNRESAVKFLEYLASPSAQKYLADGNNEYPVLESVEPTGVLKALGDFEADDINVALYGEHQATAQMIFDRAGWK